MTEGSPAGRPETMSLPVGLHPLSELRTEQVSDLGDEAQDLASLVSAGLPVAHGWLVRLGDEPAARLEQAIGMALADGEVARLRPFFPTRAASLRFERRMGTVPDVGSTNEVGSTVAKLLDVIGAPDLTASVGGALGALTVRVISCDRDPSGRAASSDPVHGDPDEVSVLTRSAPAARWRVDRRTMRISAAGEGIEPAAASEVADLADRAQLALGYPVEIDWCSRGGRFGLVGVRPFILQPTFGTGTWRRVALFAADESTVAPLAVDALDMALGRGEPPSVEPHVRRIYARPYRRMLRHHIGPRSTDPASIARASARAARVAVDVAAPLAAVRKFEQGLDTRLAGLDAVDLHRLDDEALIQALRERKSLVADALVLLDRGRVATLAVLAAIEATVGPLPREVIAALAAPKMLRSRRRLEDRLRRLGAKLEAELGSLAPPDRRAPALERRWAEAKRSLADVRPLGIDLRRDAIGASDIDLLAAIREARKRSDDVAERSRRDALRRVVVTARMRPFGPAREVLSASLSLLAGRVTQSKGSASEGLAAALLRLRRAACEAGRRLVDACVLDEPEDTLYLHLSEIEEALRGEPGAYASRVRLRREDDARWARFGAPRRIEGRR